MSFADEVEAVLNKTKRCKTCIVLSGLEPKRRDEVQAFILANPDKTRRISIVLKESDGVSVSEASLKFHAREQHVL